MYYVIQVSPNEERKNVQLIKTPYQENYALSVSSLYEIVEASGISVGSFRCP